MLDRAVDPPFDALRVEHVSTFYQLSDISASDVIFKSNDALRVTKLSKVGIVLALLGVFEHLVDLLLLLFFFPLLLRCAVAALPMMTVSGKAAKVHLLRV